MAPFFVTGKMPLTQKDLLHVLPHGIVHLLTFDFQIELSMDVLGAFFLLAVHCEWLVRHGLYRGKQS